MAGADSPRSSTEPLPLAVAKEAKVSDMEDDKLEDEDLPSLDQWVAHYLTAWQKYTASSFAFVLLYHLSLQMRFVWLKWTVLLKNENLVTIYSLSSCPKTV